MPTLTRRSVLGLGATAAGGLALGACVDDADAQETAAAQDPILAVEHVVILLQENRSFDHYLGTMRGMRGFGDRFTIPVDGQPSVFHQRSGKEVVLPFRLDAKAGNALRAGGTPHSFLDAHAAWNEGRMAAWPEAKTALSMGYYDAEETSFQRALSELFTTCDAYHCSFQGGTLPNRFFAFTGTNDPLGKAGGPATDNSHEALGKIADGYTWVSYAERLEAAGISWKVYQDFDDVFGDNPLVGLRSFRDAFVNDPGSPLVEKGLGSPLKGADLTGLREDVLAGRLPKVSWIVAPAKYSEHPGPSSPTEGAYYVQEVISALTASPEVFAKTALFVTFDENDGFFDHVPPPCAPSVAGDETLGASTVDDVEERAPNLGWIYGPGPRVPLWIVSPWTRGGWVCSESFDHTSLLRFLERRFGVAEPNIPAFRRAMLGDLVSAFDFSKPDLSPVVLPSRSKDEVAAIITAQEALPKVTAPTTGTLPTQPAGTRPSRALPYRLEVRSEIVGGAVKLTFESHGPGGAVFHVHDRKDLAKPPRRYGVGAGKSLTDTLPQKDTYDLFVLGPNGFHRAVVGTTAPLGGASEVELVEKAAEATIVVRCKNGGAAARIFVVDDPVYGAVSNAKVEVAPGATGELAVPVAASGRWYDVAVRLSDDATYLRRFAGRVENGEPSISDPALGA